MTLPPSLRRFDKAMPALALLLAAATIALSVRVGLQLRALHGLRGEVAYQEDMVRDYGGRGARPIGIALLSAGPADVPAAVADRLRKQASEAGLSLGSVAVAGRDPAGPNMQIVSVTLSGAGDAAAVDRFARWLDSNSASVALRRLSLRAGTAADGAPATEVLAEVAVLAAVSGGVR